MLGESAEAGDAELGAPGGGGRWSRQRKRPGPLAGRGVLGRQGSQGARVPLGFQEQQISAILGAATSSVTPSGGARSTVEMGEGQLAPGPSGANAAATLALH